jgi:hypothetical protein
MQAATHGLGVQARAWPLRSMSRPSAALDVGLEHGGQAVTAPADYDLNAIVDALVTRYQGMDTGDDLAGVPLTVAAYGEIVGDVQPPALLFELDDLTWDLNMGNGADEIGIVGTYLVQNVDAKNAQRSLRTALSRKADGSLARIKAKLEQDITLGGLVSYVILGSARRTGQLTYDGVDYLGAELVFEVVS